MKLDLGTDDRQVNIDAMFLSPRGFEVLCMIRDGDARAFRLCPYAKRTVEHLERAGLTTNPDGRPYGWKLTDRGRRLAVRLKR